MFAYLSVTADPVFVHAHLHVWVHAHIRIDNSSVHVHVSLNEVIDFLSLLPWQPVENYSLQSDGLGIHHRDQHS